MSETPTIDASVFVAPTAQIFGEVDIGAESPRRGSPRKERVGAPWSRRPVQRGAQRPPTVMLLILFSRLWRLQSPGTWLGG